MQLILIWVIITIIIGRLRLNNEQYLSLSFLMLYMTYFLYHTLNPPFELSLKNAIIISIIPNAFFWYLAYHCNDFLWVYPYEKGTFVMGFLIYSYILIYIVCEW